MGRIQPITFLAIAWLFCLVIDRGSAIKCWECRSEVDPACGDPFNNKTLFLTDCAFLPGATASSPNKCKAIKEDGLITRSCALASEINVPTKCTKAKNDKGVMVETCYCDNDQGCNSMAVNTNAAVSTVPILGMIFVLLLGVITYTM